MTIRLVKNGIFPIQRNRKGQLLETGPNTGYPLSGTIQGEGKLSGLPVLFVRTAGCNLRCSWINDKGEVDICDTPYSSHRVTDDEEWEIKDIIDVISFNLGEIRHVVISGGEPTIQPRPLLQLVSALKKKLKVHITLETNGVHYVPELAWHIDLFSISPKLRSSEPTPEKNKHLESPISKEHIRDHARLRKNTANIQKYINACMNLGSYYGDNPATSPTKRGDKDFQLKFVVAREEDEQEIKKEFLDHLGFVRNEDVLVMPLGSNPEVMHKHMHLAAKMAIRNGWRYTQRVQLNLFGDKEGT